MPVFLGCALVGLQLEKHVPWGAAGLHVGAVSSLDLDFGLGNGADAGGVLVD